MKKGFVRVLWGVMPDEYSSELRKKFEIEHVEDYSNNCVVRNGARSRDRIKKNIKICPLPFDYTTYVFGENNKKFLDGLNVKNVLIHNEPFKYHPIKRVWVHKLYALKYAMEEDGYDELIYLDWDCFVINKNIDENIIWEKLRNKDIFQACLMKYTFEMIGSRKNKMQNKVVPNGGFIYIRGKTISSQIMECSNKLVKNKWSDEAAYATFLDEYTGGWKGLDFYWNNFEPEICVNFKSVYGNKKNKNNVLFRHARRF